MLVPTIASVRECECLLLLLESELDVGFDLPEGPADDPVVSYSEKQPPSFR